MKGQGHRSFHLHSMGGHLGFWVDANFGFPWETINYFNHFFC